MAKVFQFSEARLKRDLDETIKKYFAEIMEELDQMLAKVPPADQPVQAVMFLAKRLAEQQAMLTQTNQLLHNVVEALEAQ